MLRQLSIHKAQLMLTNPRDAFTGQSRSPNKNGTIRTYDFLLVCAIVTLSIRRIVFEIFDFKNVVILRPRYGSLEVIGKVTIR